MEGRNICHTCGEPVPPHSKDFGVVVKRGQNGFLFPAIIGSLAGLAIGIGFVIYGFGIYAGFFHTMALIHEAAGTLLGLSAGLIAGFLRK